MRRAMWIGSVAALLLAMCGFWLDTAGAQTPTSTETSYATPTPFSTIEEITINLPNLPAGAKPLVMVRIPAGSFKMGSNDPGWSGSDEVPVHTVSIGYNFYMGKWEVTQAQWQAVMRNNPSYFSGNDNPVEQVSWNDCQSFITSLNGLRQGTFRLPSEAEWEYACRAGTMTRFYFGDSSCSPSSCSSCDLSHYAWYCNNSPYGTEVVGQLHPNAFGLYDIHGNIWEWCQDYWHESYTDAPTDGSAWESPTSSYRVLRGGGRYIGPEYCRSSCRVGDNPDLRDDDVGVRLVHVQ